MNLYDIFSPDDLKKCDINDLKIVASQVREILINKASKSGGHLASNLGVVELTIALHYVFDSPKDKIIFDVSHQSYVHKIITGRKEFFINEDISGISGYTNPDESIHDIFNIGHTSTSISLACGLAKARDIKHGNENIIAVIGDSSLDGGEAFEGINYAGEMGSGLIVVVNDNNMSIPENHGYLSNKLSELRTNKGECKDNYFKSLGWDYVFVEDGHNIKSLIDVFNNIKDIDRPVVVHCCTKKGKGFIFAENNPEKWHWAHPFDIETGEYYSSVPKENYGAIVGEYLIKKMSENDKIVAITASVPAYIGFNKDRRNKAGKQYVDVGIAEQNAISMAAGMARNGIKPVFVTGSSFYQRAYDQIEQEMCINHCAATLLVAFSGINGHLSNAHAGLYDIALLGNIPNLLYLAPTNKEEYIAMLDWSIEQNDIPVAIRIPWNGVYHASAEVETNYSNTKYLVEYQGTDIAIIALGSFYQLGEELLYLLKNKYGLNPTLINPRFITGIDTNTLERLKKEHSIVITLEDGILSGGFGSKIAQYYGPSDMKVLSFGFSMDIPTTFTVDEMMEKNNLKPDLMAKEILKIINNKH